MHGPRYESSSQPLCGCWFILPAEFRAGKCYLPQVALESHTTILATTSKTVLHQTFVNPRKEALKEVSYTFPLYDGVSVAGFKCTVAGRIIVGMVKERNQARAEYQEAIDKGQTAGLLEQTIDAADVFTTSIGNVPAGEKLLVEITYLGELKNDAETDGARFTIPTQIAPRYGTQSASFNTGIPASDSTGMKITVDVALETGVSIRGIQSPSHPIAVTMGRTSTMVEDDDSFENNLGSSTLALGSTELDKDFVVVISAKGQDIPRALLETHPSLPNQRALMASLVPKFNIPSGHPEIVFVVDRSGSMNGKMHLVIEAMKVFLKSLPVSVKFNICSFGSRHTFLFEKSKTYDAASLEAAMAHLDPRTFGAGYGGTEMIQPLNAVLERRYKDLPLEVMLLTDGEIWNQDFLFGMVNKASGGNARFFTLGVGSSASSSLVEGIARAGRGFSQWVNDGERIDKRLVRMLKGALTPHIKYKLEVKYVAAPDSDDDDFEIVESFDKSMKLVANENTTTSTAIESGSVKQEKRKVSLFDAEAKDEPTNPAAGRYDHLPSIAIPNVLQVPHQLPELYSHSRSTVYLLLGSGAPQRMPTSVTLRGTSDHGDLELEIPVQDVGTGSTIHQLAAKKAMQDLEEGRGWLEEAQAAGGKTLKSQNEGSWDLIVEREAVRLGTTFQVGGKFCSFVAIDEDEKDIVASEGQASPSPLQQHQMSLMLLEQQNKKRKMMARAAPQTQYFAMSAVAPPPSGASLFGSSGVSHEYRESPSTNRVAAQGTLAAQSGPRSSFIHPQRQNSQMSQVQMPQMQMRQQQAPSGSGLFSSSTSFYMTPANAPPPAQFDPATLAQVQQQASLAAAGPLGQSTGGLLSLDVDACLSRPAVAPVGIPSNGLNAKAEEFVPTRVDALAPLEKMQKLIDLQTFSGSWTVSDDLLAILSHDAVTPFKSAADVEHAVGEKGAAMDKDAMATVLAVAWLEAVMSDEEDVWEMVVEKAKAWLQGNIGNGEEVKKLVEGCKGLWKVELCS
ncbi:hypothetical protein PMZ80_003640 [Knufia obscura]|uniref:Uncharacterized protein n=2 Tax=Knufia TaxID=430999 RepID=A0AAN8ISR1_9EURO|nr:hypothetical protein PMZ80_003640 [Knufia obscura]KAK5958447.1 hypothetical protein OHC33_000290 [Knufia fluminis]